MLHSAIAFSPQYISIGVECEHGSTRLVGDSSGREGAVQVCFQGVWASIISNSWGFPEARAACRSLGQDEYGIVHKHRCVMSMK